MGRKSMTAPADLNQAKNPDLRASWIAIQRAAKMARDIAIQTNTNLVVVRNGQIEYIPPEELLRQKLAENNDTNPAP
jgi:hypothetical protein